MSLTRNVPAGHSRTVQLRLDVQNVLNRQHWQDANTNPTSTNFGKVTTVTQNFMRFITFGFRLNF
jgi:outer membrane receptor protein involved in Fe transport